jgi:hypothetical protein
MNVFLLQELVDDAYNDDEVVYDIAGNRDNDDIEEVLH